MSSTLKHCSSCGRRVPADAPAELCPSCLMKGGFSHDEPLVESKTDSGSTLHLVIPEDAPLPEGAPTQLGSYEVLERIARGGMGVVYKARHTGLDRVVALKMIRSGILATPRDVERFQREARSAAKLHHPNIVTIHDIGEQDGQHYYTMDYVPGENLSERARTKPFSARQAAEITAGVAAAIHYAHEHGVLHRDIKPANVILTPEQQPRVLDFGLALVLTDDSALTQSGTPIGSPSYMPPEQAAGRTRHTDARSDVYSLGALLYELLTGRPPFQAATTVETLKLVVENEAVSPRRLNPALPRDLETICLKCLEKAPERRYQSAQGLADELGRFLRDEPILARPVSQLETAWRWCRRKPAQASAIGTGLLLLLVVLIGQPLVTYRINAERKRAEAALEKEAASGQRAETAERESQQQLYTALLEQARATVPTAELGQRVRALDAVRRAAAISNSAELRGVAVAALALPDLRFERELPVASDLTLVKLDDAFERIALCRGNGPVEIRSASNDQLIATLPASTNLPAYSGEWSSDGRFLAVRRDRATAGRVTKDVEVWEISAPGGARRVLLVRDTAGASAFHPRLARIVIAPPRAEIVTWDLETGRELARHRLDAPSIQLEFSPDGERFATTQRSRQGTVFAIHRTADATVLASRLLSNHVARFQWHPSGRWIAAGDSRGAVHLVDAQTTEMRVIGWHKNDARTAVFSPDGRYLFSGGWDRQLICWDVMAMRRAFTIGLDSYQVQLRADGRQCAILRWPEVRLQLHAFEPPAQHRELAGDLGGSRNYASFSPDGRWLAASGSGERLAVWDLTSDGPPARLKQSEEAHVDFAANGELFSSNLGHCSRWKVSPGTNGPEPILQRLELAMPAGFSSLCLISNGVVLNSARGSKIASLNELATEQSAWTSTADGPVAASQDGQWLVVLRRSSPYLYVHRLPGFERVAKLTNEARIWEFEFSPKGDELAVGTASGVEFWSTTNWQRTRRLMNFTGILYSADAQTFWLSAGSRAAGLHDARTAEALLPLPPNTLPLALSPDGRHLAVSVDARRVQVWDLAEVRLRLRELGLDWASDR